VVTDFTTYANAGGSRYEAGILLYVRRPNFNSANNPNGGIAYVKVTGPGLPSNGIVLADVDSALPQDWMGILNTTGTIPTGTQQFAGTDGGSTGNIFILQRTQAITGTQAFSIRPNPSVGSATPTLATFAHPAMYGQAPSNSWVADVSGVVAWAQYTYQAYDGTSATPSLTWTQSLLSPLVPANFAASQQWHNFGTSSRAFTAAGAAAVPSVTMDWINNALAERPRNAFVFTNSYASNNVNAAITARVNASTVRIARGATSAVLSGIVGTTPTDFLPLTPLPTTNSRTLQMDHYMLDGGHKDYRIIYN
jgi:hypothetical protein